AVFCWGNNNHGQLGLPATIGFQATPSLIDVLHTVALAAGDNHACAVAGDGSVSCWGANAQGQLRNGMVTGDHAAPSAVIDAAGLAFHAAAVNSARPQIAAGADWSCAFDLEQRTYCWGSPIGSHATLAGSCF